MIQTFRLSRLKAPRGTLAAMVLLAVVFIGFGIAVSTASTTHGSADRHFGAGDPSTVHWPFGR